MKIEYKIFSKEPIIMEKKMNVFVSVPKLVTVPGLEV